MVKIMLTTKLKNFISSFVSSEDGATAIEYGLIAALIAVAIVVAAGQLGTDLSGLFTDVSTELNGAIPD